MKRVFENIYKNLSQTAERNMNTENLVIMSKENFEKNKNLIVFDFVFDNNGDYIHTVSEHGFGKSVNLRGKITVPGDGAYSVNIRSSDSGGGKWDNIKADQEVSCVINTSFWHETTITVCIHSNKPNCNGHAIIDYSI